MTPPTSRRVALVTGSSRGLGKAIALRLGADGYAVAVNAASVEADSEDVVVAIREAGGTAQAFAADVTDEQHVVRLVAEVRDALGPIDTLVVNATGPQPTAPVDEVRW